MTKEEEERRSRKGRGTGGKRVSARRHRDVIYKRGKFDNIDLRRKEQIRKEDGTEKGGR